MTAQAPAPTMPQEVELKLAVPVSDPAGLLQRLSRHPVLARRTARRLQLHNIYLDTPRQALRQAGAVLRLRRETGASSARWLQTLKISPQRPAALSRRGEWEMPVQSAALERDALPREVWSGLDPAGDLFDQLAPCFETVFDRACWQVRRRDGSWVELALDIGEVRAGGRRERLCELEFELRAGPPGALFRLARELSGAVPMLPLDASKSARGFALAQGPLPRIAAPVTLADGMLLADAAYAVLRETSAQFTGNLALLLHHRNAELVHQARVGWRRMRSAARLFGAAAQNPLHDAIDALQPLCQALGDLRDTAVTRHDVLAPLQDMFIAEDPRRAACWRRMLARLDRLEATQHAALLACLQQPAIGRALLDMTAWLEDVAPPVPDDPGAARQTCAAARRIDRDWALTRLRRLERKLLATSTEAPGSDGGHRRRILAKRLRYGIEFLRPLLPKRWSRKALRQAAHLQRALGDARDLAQAVALLHSLPADTAVREFVRGVQLGRQREAPD